MRVVHSLANEYSTLSPLLSSPLPVRERMKVRVLVQRASFARESRFCSFRCLVFVSTIANIRPSMRPDRISAGERAPLRREQTDAERILWRHLRGRQMQDANFGASIRLERTSPISARLERRLVIELDGTQHAEHLAKMKSVLRFSKSEGLSGVRFWNDQVLENVDEVLSAIDEFLRRREHKNEENTES